MELTEEMFDWVKNKMSKKKEIDILKKRQTELMGLLQAGKFTEELKREFNTNQCKLMEIRRDYAQE